MRAALRWMNSDGQADVALKVSTALWRFWYVRGHLSEGREWLTELVALAGPSDRSALRASALNGLGTIALRQGDHTVARSLYEETLAICRQLGDQAGIALGLGNLGNVAHDEGDNVAARSLHEDGLIISRQLGDQAGIALGLGNLGNVLHDQGDLETARLLHQERLALARELGDQRGIAYSIADLGDLARDQGDPETARLLAEESLGICQQLGDLRGIAYALESLAKVALATARTTHAVLLFGAAGLLREAIGAPLAPKEHGDLQAALVASRVALGDLAFEAAWAEVQSMALQQAVEYALASDEPTTTGAVPQEDAAGSRRPGLLTAREREVAVLIARGLTNRQIAEALVISERTADTHVGNILGKLGLATRAQVAAWAVEHKLLETRSG